MNPYPPDSYEAAMWDFQQAKRELWLAVVHALHLPQILDWLNPKAEWLLRKFGQ